MSTAEFTKGGENGEEGEAMISEQSNTNLERNAPNDSTQTVRQWFCGRWKCIVITTIVIIILVAVPVAIKLTSSGDREASPENVPTNVSQHHLEEISDVIDSDAIINSETKCKSPDCLKCKHSLDGPSDDRAYSSCPLKEGQNHSESAEVTVPPSGLKLHDCCADKQLCSRNRSCNNGTCVCDGGALKCKCPRGLKGEKCLDLDIEYAVCSCYKGFGVNKIIPSCADDGRLVRNRSWTQCGLKLWSGENCLCNKANSFNQWNKTDAPECQQLQKEAQRNDDTSNAGSRHNYISTPTLLTLGGWIMHWQWR